MIVSVLSFICQTLNRERAGGFVSSRGYRAAKTRPPSVRSLNDAVLIGQIATIIRGELQGVWGAQDVACPQTLRLECRTRAGRPAHADGEDLWCSQRPDPHHHPQGQAGRHAPRSGQRQFTADRPHHLWVADMTYLRTKVGFVYTAFVTDVFSRKIVGWSTRSSMKTQALPLEALDQAIAQARGNLEGARATQ